MIKLLFNLKNKYSTIWEIILFINGIIFKLLYNNRIKRNGIIALKNYKKEKYTYRFLSINDLELLHTFLNNQNQYQFNFFKPHKFDKLTLNRILKSPSNFVFGVFDQQKLIGYFFIRCYINKECFLGRIVDEDYQGQGIAKRMGKILYQIAWTSNFRIFSTISKHNIKSLKSHLAINNYKIIEELENEYYLIEYLKSEEKDLK